MVSATSAGYELRLCVVMLKVGVDEADDAKRQAVLKDWLGWLTDRC